MYLLHRGKLVARGCFAIRSKLFAFICQLFRVKTRHYKNKIITYHVMTGLSLTHGLHMKFVTKEYTNFINLVYLTCIVFSLFKSYMKILRKIK